MCKNHLPEPICQTLSVMWRTVESWDRGGGQGWGAGLLGWRAPYPSNLAPGRAIKLLGISAAKVDKVMTERTDSFWSQCGNMSSQEEAGIIRRGGKPRGGEQGGGGNHL